MLRIAFIAHVACDCSNMPAKAVPVDAGMKLNIVKMPNTTAVKAGNDLWLLWGIKVS